MQATRDVLNEDEPSPYLEQRSSRAPEYVYQAAILVAVLLVLWTVA